MSNTVAISFKDVRQSYPLYQSPREAAMDVLGLNKFLRRKSNVQMFHALKGIDLTVNKGERLGIIGQNGAGKTTLLKLITKNFFPTSGSIEVYGQVQSLMDSGVGFHPEFTGLENIKSSLVYNNLSARETKEAIEDIIDFAELGDFIHQPIKTYSLGMISRLGFATSTSLNPEILIIDEIMGAGDAYFAAKSAERMKRLTQGGTTLLLVSHATAQIIQFCQNAIWMKEGQIRMQGEALEVSKAYERYMRDLDEQRLERSNKDKLSKRTLIPEQENTAPMHVDSIEDGKIEEGVESISSLAQVSSQSDSISENGIHDKEQASTKRNLVRWNGLGKLRIEDFFILDAHDQKRFTFHTGEKIKFVFKIRAEEENHYPVIYNMVTYTLSGQPATVHTFERNEYFEKNEVKTIQLTYPKLMLGNGDFVISLAIYKQLNLDDDSTALFYDLIDRSFEFKVINKHKHDRTTFLHPAEWEIVQN